MLVLALLTACNTTEADVRNAALAYRNTKLDVAAQWDMACSDDQQAKSKEDLLGAMAFGMALAGGAVKDLAEGTTFEAVSTSVDGDTASVVVKAIVNGADGATSTVDLRRQGDGWCVVTGWAAEAERERLEEERRATLARIGEELKAVAVKVEDFDIDGATSDLARLKAEVDALGGDVSTVTKALAATSELVDTMKSMHVVGRWTRQSEVDPISDKRTVTAILTSTERLPARYGDPDFGRLVARCAKGRFDVFVNLNDQLRYDFLTDRLKFDSRFGAEPASKARGGVSTDRRAVFLDKAMTDALIAHDGGTWLIQAPTFMGGDRRAAFDLTGAKQVMEPIRSECR